MPAVIASWTECEKGTHLCDVSSKVMFITVKKALVKSVHWTHTFILHDVMDNLPHGVIVFTQGVIHVWKIRRQIEVLALPSV